MRLELFVILGNLWTKWLIPPSWYSSYSTLKSKPEIAEKLPIFCLEPWRTKSKTNPTNGLLLSDDR